MDNITVTDLLFLVLFWILIDPVANYLLKRTRKFQRRLRKQMGRGMTWSVSS